MAIVEMVLHKPSESTFVVGKVSVPLAQARRWVVEYTDPRSRSSARPFAYPAYDNYESDANTPWQVTDADLLAPGLLNVPVKIRSYYDLQAIRSELEVGLSNPDLELPLAQVTDLGRVAAMVQPLYAVLDDPLTRPWNVKATTLSKILHRKRPKSLVLRDRWVSACYVGMDAPVPSVRNRSWADYMTAVTAAIAQDIRTQGRAFEVLDEATGLPGALSYVRLLDIVAWSSRGRQRSEAEYLHLDT